MLLPAKILAVDDRPANLAALNAILEPLGYDVVNASSGTEALSRLLDEDFALILMDVQMPELDGFQTTALIKQRDRTRHIPVIFVTALSVEREHVQRGYAVGAADFLIKPFSPEQLERRGAELVRVESERRRAQAADAEAAFVRFADHLPQPLFAAREDGRLWFWNAAFRAYAGAAGLEAIHPDDASHFDEAWRAALHDGRGFQLEVGLRRSDGVHRRHLLRVTPERDGQKRIVRWTVLAQDIESERAAAQVRDAFLSTISHELRAPLNAIVGWTALLQSGRLDEERAHAAIETVARNAEAQKRIIEELLDVSHILAGDLRLDVQAVSFAEVVREATERFRPACATKGLALTLNISDDSAVTGDRVRLDQIVTNLVGNAVKFTPQGGTLEVRLEREGSRLELTVRDSGVGIGNEFLGQVFEPFRQEDAITQRRQGGLGLGLALVRHLVDMHHGTVCAHSEGPGEGATFVVRLPVRVVQAPAREPSGELRLDGAPPLLGISVLVVDDEPDARELLTALLATHGARVRAVGSAQAALQELIAELPDVVVSDIGMPDEDGLQLVRKLRALERTQGGMIPAVALSGFTGAEDRRRGYAAGFQEYLTKPVEADLLVKRLASLAPRRK